MSKRDSNGRNRLLGITGSELAFLRLIRKREDFDSLGIWGLYVPPSAPYLQSSLLSICCSQERFKVPFTTTAKSFIAPERRSVSSECRTQALADEFCAIAADPCDV